VKLTPLALSLGDLAELWSALTKEPYAPSVVYVASLVSMSPDVTLAVGSCIANGVEPTEYLIDVLARIAGANSDEALDRTFPTVGGRCATLAFGIP
jgi:hypothetical protein